MRLPIAGDKIVTYGQYKSRKVVTETVTVTETKKDGWWYFIRFNSWGRNCVAVTAPELTKQRAIELSFAGFLERYIIMEDNERWPTIDIIIPTKNFFSMPFDEQIIEITKEIQKKLDKEDSRVREL